ncbi:MAG: trehalose synthase, partial [Chloroflexota bacterium]
TVQLDLALGERVAELGEHAVMLDLLRNADVPVGQDGKIELQLAGYDYRWLRMPNAADSRLP